MATKLKNFRIHRYNTRMLRTGCFFPNNISIVQCHQGTANVEINSHKITLQKGKNFILNSTSLVKIVELSNDAECTLVEFSSNFIRNYCPLVTNQVFDIIGSVTPDKYASEDYQFGELTFLQLELISRVKDFTNRNVVVSNLLTNYLLHLYESLRNRVHRDSITTSSHIDSLLIDFWGLCKECHTKQRKVEYYATRLNISARYLHRLCKEHLGMAPKRVIDHCIVSSAKRLLITTAKTSQEISIELSFPDQTTFGQFFKRHIGLSPSQYRSSNEK